MTRTSVTSATPRHQGRSVPPVNAAPGTDCQAGACLGLPMPGADPGEPWAGAALQPAQPGEEERAGGGSTFQDQHPLRLGVSAGMGQGPGAMAAEHLVPARLRLWREGESLSLPTARGTVCPGLAAWATYLVAATTGGQPGRMAGTVAHRGEETRGPHRPQEASTHAPLLNA